MVPSGQLILNFHYIFSEFNDFRGSDYSKALYKVENSCLTKLYLAPKGLMIDSLVMFRKSVKNSRKYSVA